MSEPPLDVLVLWHMHQPLYQNLATGRMMMPWVRLHAAKDYLDMVLLLEEFPDIHVNMNWVPSLLDQIQDYASGKAQDDELDLSLANPEAMTPLEKAALLRTHFQANERRMIERFPRYAELRRLCANPASPSALQQGLPRFSNQDIRDLQVWFNLAWIDPLIRQIDPVLSSLVRKGRNFTEDEKAEVLRRHRDIAGKIIPATMAAWEKGNLEVSVSPYYHPILPLLCDTNYARRARPQMPLPQHRFTHPEDAEAQITEALARAEELFHRRPVGMWPSEGSVCDEIIPMLGQAGVQWIATDEEVLGMSLGLGNFARDRDGNVIDMERLYRPWRRNVKEASVSLVFRDHAASDLIGFQFANWPAESAADALIARLEYAARHVPHNARRHAVSIILDGENCWEYYEEDGLPFLRAFYKKLSESPLLRSVTISQHLADAGAIEELPALHSGSWINHDYSVWIGHPEDNLSWDYLAEARTAYEKRIKADPPLSAEARALARKSLMIAEGSDWNWWYGDEHHSDHDQMFDQLYREHLSNVYRFMGMEPPARFAHPIKKTRVEIGHTEPKAFLQPRIDGRASSYFEWYDAGRYDPAQSGGAMRQTTDSLLGRFFFGFDIDTLYLRVDLADNRPWSADPRIDCAILILGAHAARIEVRFEQERWKARLCHEAATGGWLGDLEIEEIAADTVLEIAVPFAMLEVEPGNSIGLQVELRESGGHPERQPSHTPITLTVPDADFESRMWVV